MRHHIADFFEQKMFYGGLTYSSHLVSLAAALATIGVYEEDGLIDNAARLGARMREHHERLAAKHPSVGAHRNLGLFGILDLVRTRSVDPDDRVQRHVRRDEGGRRLLPRARALR